LEQRRPAAAWTIGFDREDPALATLVDALEARGTVVRSRDLDDPGPAASPLLLRAGSRAAELRRVAATIRKRLAVDPSLRVGVLAPDIASSGALIERIFEEELDPKAVVRLDGEAVRLFDQ